MRLWAFRFVVVIVIPTVLLLGIETGLRVFGYGVPAGFTFEQKVGGQERILSNPYFTWRFFAPQLAREGIHFSLPPVKRKGTYRIFVLGASAAQGDPEASYGMTRMLEAMLRNQYPGVDFDVINAAITAINSHVVLPIARDCSRLESDLFVIYLGNNEVVGPHGAGSVFSPLVPDLSMIRVGIALKATRLGQLLSNAVRKMAGADGVRPGKWRGMEMFLDHQVRATDTGLETVYRHFERNLTDICRVAQESGIPAIVSTVGVNLKDNSPFASLHRAGLSEQEVREWEDAVREGEALREQGEPHRAIQRFLKAEQIDADHAALHFRLGRCYWTMWDFRKAREHYVKALELDTLRFRADTRINEAIRRVAWGKAAKGIHFVDSMQVLEANSPERTPGNGVFYEHVHLNFRGTYLVARAIFERVQRVLPGWVSRHASGRAVLSEDECAQRLAYTGLDRLTIARDLLAQVQDPPFTNQIYADELADRFSREVEMLQLQYNSDGGRQQALEQYRGALRDDPHWHLRDAYARLQYHHLGNPREAEKHWKMAIQQCPQSSAVLGRLGMALSSQGKNSEARGYYRKALMYRPQSASTLSSFGSMLLGSGDVDQAIEYFREAIGIDPRSAAAHSNLGKAMALESNDPESRQQASWHLRKAVDIDPDHALARENLAAFYIKEALRLASRNEKRRARALLRQATELVPANAAERQKLEALLNTAGR